MVNLELYRIFVMVAKEQNITKASEKLNISQPAVTKHIRNLEEQLDLKLFNRTNYGMTLTDIGKKIYDEIKESIGILEDIQNKYQKTRDIKLGSHSTMLNKIFGKIIKQYYKEVDNGKISIQSDDTNEMIKKLKNKELDIVLSKKQRGTYESKIQFTKLGELTDVIIADKKANISEDTIDIGYLKENVFYMPRKTSPTSINFFESISCKQEEFKNIRNLSYRMILDIVKESNVVGLVTREYINEEIENNEFKILKTEFAIKPIEYGYYINKENKFKNLTILERIIKSNI